MVSEPEHKLNRLVPEYPALLIQLKPERSKRCDKVTLEIDIRV